MTLRNTIAMFFMGMAISFSYSQISNESAPDWVLKTYMGIASSAFEKSAVRPLTSKLNFGLDVKKQLRPNLNLVVASRHRIDSYKLNNFIKLDTRELSDDIQSTFFQNYQIFSHSILLENQLYNNNWGISPYGGVGVSFVKNRDFGIRKVDPSETGINYTSGFSAAQLARSYFFQCGIEVAYRITSRFHLNITYNYSYDYNHFYQILPIIINKNGVDYASLLKTRRDQHICFFGIGYVFR